MSVYSPGSGELEFLPMSDISETAENGIEGRSCIDDQQMVGQGKGKQTKPRPIYKRSFKATLSSSDVLTQLENAALRLKPTPTMQTGGKAVLPLKESTKEAWTATTSGFRPVLRQTNSESNLDAHRQALYRSPQAFLTIRKHRSQTTCFINKLSDEVLLQVLQYLPKASVVRCSKVCRRWARLSKDEVLWNRMDLGAKRIDASSVHRIINRGVQCFRLSRAEIRCDQMDFARTAVCRLKFLDLSMAVCSTPNIIRDVLTRCRSLCGLSLESCQLNEDTETFSAIGRNSDLKFLNLALCRGLTQTGVSYILNGCHKLVELNLAWTCLDQKAVRLACRMMPETMLRLNLSGCRNNTMLDEDVESLVESCARVEELDLSDCTDITGRSLQAICNHLSQLRCLHSSRCYAIDPMAYISCCKQLGELNIFGTIKEDSMPVLQRALKNVHVNVALFSTIARPTTGIRRTSIWEQRTRDDS